MNLMKMNPSRLAEDLGRVGLWYAFQQLLEYSETTEYQKYLIDYQIIIESM